MSIYNRLINQGKSAGVLLYLTVGAGFLAAAFFICQAWLLGIVVNQVFIEKQSLADLKYVLWGMLVLAIIRAVMIWIKDWLGQLTSNQIKDTLWQKLNLKLFTLGPAYILRQRSGELVNTIVDGVDTLDDYITQYLPARFLAILVPCFVLLVIFILDPWTTLILVISGPILVLILYLIGLRAKNITERRFLELSWMSAFFLDILQGIATLKTFGRSREQIHNIKTISQKYSSTTMEVLRTAFQTSLVMEWAATAATAMAALEISLRIMYSNLPFDRGLTALLLVPEFYLPLRQLALKFHSGTTGNAAANRIFAILDTESSFFTPVPSLESKESYSTKKKVTFHKEIQFSHVSFAYDNGHRPALNEFNLTIPYGKTIALVGASGAGKTTVANMLLYFIAPQSGKISIDGISLQDFSPTEWLEQVAWVPQHPHMFYGSVRDNILLAKPEASEGEVVAAAKAANADEFIEHLPQGYSTQIGEQGVRLSGGQRQRIAIARAFLKNSPLLILDEATAYLDRENEKLIEEALKRLMYQRTVLIIAHRLRFAYQANRIIVMDQGKAVEIGDHLSLINQDGQYRKLVATYERGSL